MSGISDFVGPTPPPPHWQVRKLGHLAMLKSGESITSEEITDNGEFPVFGGNGRRGFSSRFTHNGDFVLIGRQGALCGNINYASGKFFASEHAVVVHPLCQFATIWMGELLRSMNLNQYSQSAAQPGLSVAKIRALRIPVPPLDEQQLIAQFLQRETAQIDQLIQSKRMLIDLVREKRAARISQLVTGGLDPASKTKPSGFPTIGAVPAHWGIFRSKVLLSEIDERTTDANTDELLTVSHITGVTPRAEKPDVTMFMAESLDGYKRCQKNDLVINTMWAWMGALGVSKYNGVVSPGYNVYRFKRQVIPEYFDCLYRTPQYIAEFTRWSKGVWSSRLRLYPDEFFQILTPIPPLDEQEKIVKAIREETGGYEDSIRILEESIDRLSQYRIALITSAVTGQVDVREYRTQGVASCP